MKKCSSCGNIKDLCCFPVRKDSPDGYRNQCIICRKEYNIKWRNGEIEKKAYRDNAEEKQCRDCMLVFSITEFYDQKVGKDKKKCYCKECLKKKKQEWLRKNPDYYKNYREKNVDKIREIYRRYNENNANRISAIKKNYRITNYKNIKNSFDEWYAKNKSSVMYKKKIRRNTSIQLRISERLRSRVRGALVNSVKVGSAVCDLGCSIEKLRKYFEEKFYLNHTTGEMMTWENISKWHIDHIRPLSSFDLTDIEQFKKACHYTNLQPLWAEDNLRKGSRYERVR